MAATVTRGNGVVVCLGEACLEYIAHTDGYPKGEKHNSTRRRSSV